MAQNIEEIHMSGNKIFQTDTFPPMEGERFYLDGVLKFEDK